MFLVLDIGGTNCRVAVFEENIKRPKLIEYIKLSKDINNDLIRIKEVIGSYKDSINAVVLALAGVVDKEKNILLKSPHIPSWVGINLKDTFRKLFDCPLHVFNDTYLAAYGEAYSSNYRKDFWYLNWGSGIGGCLAKWENDEWKLYASEPGHMVLEIGGVECNCGQKGCWDILAGGKGISKRFNKLPKDLLLSEWKSIIPYMSTGLQNILAIAPAELIIIGGGIALNQPLVVDLIEKKLYQDLKIFKPPKLYRTKLSDLAAIYGGFYFLSSRV